MKLADAKEGQDFVVSSMADDDICLQALRFGIDTGTVIYVQKNITGGPVIVCKNQLEIAIGRQIAAAIEVESIPGS
jgi:Fe2+ transport system protein FeoA